MKTKPSPELLVTCTLSDGHGAYGSISLKGRNTVLNLSRAGDQRLPYLDGDVFCELPDRRKASCLGCVAHGAVNGGAGETAYQSLATFPHYVVVGDRHVTSSEELVTTVQFTTDGISSLFYDFDAFGHVIKPKLVIEDVVKANKLDRNVVIGDRPQVVYFTGKTLVIAVDTVIGNIRIEHQPSFSLPNPDGVYIKNDMMISLEPPDAICLDDIVDSIMVLQRFLTLLSGRKQGVDRIGLSIGDPAADRGPFDLHWSFAPTSGEKTAESSQYRPHPGDIPLNAIDHPDEFKMVLQDWIRRDKSWLPARVRYTSGLSKGNQFSTDRLVSAANMFDLLPAEDVPCATELSPDQIKARDDALRSFQELPRSIERDSVISALKRMHQPSLPKKVLSRIQIIEPLMGRYFPDLPLAAKAAVKLRNIFVHGGFDEAELVALNEHTAFLTETLEFIFAASDLVQAGWDPSRWLEDYHGWGHSFSRYRQRYKEDVGPLKRTLESLP